MSPDPSQQSLSFQNVRVGDRIRHRDQGIALDVLSVSETKITASRRIEISNPTEWTRPLHELSKDEEVVNIASGRSYVILGKNPAGYLVGEYRLEIKDLKGWCISVRKEQISDKDRSTVVVSTNSN